MKVIYVPRTPLGEFFYDPASHEGIGITESGPVVVGMRPDYDHRIHRAYKEWEVDNHVFSQLKDAALRRPYSPSDLEKALGYFPRAETHNSPSI